LVRNVLTTPPTAPTIAKPIPIRCDLDSKMESESLYSGPKRKGGRATSKTPAIDKVADVMSGPVNDPGERSAHAAGTQWGKEVQNSSLR
jgi:hypothetical protein